MRRQGEKLPVLNYIVLGGVERSMGDEDVKQREMVAKTERY